MRRLLSSFLLLAFGGHAAFAYPSQVFGPPSKREALMAQPDSIYEFVVRGGPATAALLHAKAQPRPAGDAVRPLKIIAGSTALLLVRDAFEIAAQPDVVQVWYLHPLLADPYVKMILGIEYAVMTLPSPGVVNMSLGPVSEVMPLPGEPDEPMNAATKVAADAGLLPIVAAGNYFRDGNEGVINPWCLPEWVVCVGAASEDMTTLWDGSAQGLSTVPSTWPDVVAFGIDVIGPWLTNVPKPPSRKAYDDASAVFRARVPENKRETLTLRSGTSQAAAQVSRATGQIEHFVKSLAESKNYSAGDAMIALSLPKANFDRASRHQRLAGEVTNRTADTVEVTYRLVEPWRLVKQLLIDTAVPMPAYRPEQVGAGFVAPSYIEKQFGAFGVPGAAIVPIKIE